MPRAAMLLLLFLGGCTFEPGRWFATLRPSLTAAYVARQDRDAGEGWQKLSTDYQIKITALRMELEPIALLASSGGGATRFDPANPPPGYTLCHNGHCHHESGRLVPYAEIEAELAGGGVGLRAAVSLVVDGALQLVTPAERTLGCQPSCNLDRVAIVRASAPIRSMAIEALVRDGRVPARVPESMWGWRLGPADGGATAAAPVLTAELDLPASERHPPDVALGLRLELTAGLFDGVDLAAAAGGVLAGPGEERLLQNLREGSFLTASVHRNDP
jgi:hypothetical protein